MLGLFDSGLGGLTVLRRVREVLPSHDVLFFADQAHVPYGDRSAADLLGLVRRNLAWLDDEGVRAIIMACNTTCATASEFGWPQSRAVVLDLIESAAIAVERGGFQRIGVIATAATARTGAYARRIHSRVPAAQVFEIAAPALVPLVEAGHLAGAQPRSAVKSVCALLPGAVDAVLLGCTHYPLLFEHFRAALDSGVAIVDPAAMQAERAVALVERLDITAGSGRLVCVTNGNLERFETSLRALIGDLAPQVRHLENSCRAPN